MSARCITILVFLAIAGCSRSSPVPVVATPADEFAAVLSRLEGEAKAKSVGGVAVSVAPPVAQPDGSRVVTAVRTNGPATATYTLTFRYTKGGWVCGDAKCVVEQPGNQSENSFSGVGIEMDQLFKWMAW